jgi:peptidyl-prolyl cis-trans isomerase SurA
MRASITLLFTALACCAWSQPNNPTPIEHFPTVDKVIAVIGDEIVLYSEMETAAMEMAKGKTPTEELRCRAFEELLYQKLLLHHAKVDSVDVTEAEVQDQVQRRIDYYMSMFGSQEEFEKYYGKSIATLKEEYFDDVHEQLLIEKEQGEASKNEKTTPADVLAYFNAQPKDSIPLIPEQVAYSQIVFEPNIGEQEINKLIHFMDSIRADIAAGRTSMTLQAAKWSEDPGSKYKGGCYPLQRRGSFVPEYEAAVFSTDEGKFTPVFKTDYGYHFVKVVEKRGDFYESCHILMSPKFKDQDLDRARIQADTVYTNLQAKLISFDDAALRYSSDEDSKNQEGKVSSMTTGGLRHEIGSLDPEINLILARLKPGEYSAPVLATDGSGKKKYVIYKLDERIVAHRANMDLDYEIFMSAATATNKRKTTDDWVRGKLKKTYIKIYPEYLNCPFEFSWLQ